MGHCSICIKTNYALEILLNKRIYIKADKNSKIVSVGIGTFLCNTVSKNNFINLTIGNVNHVSQLRYNLLSITALMKKGCRIVSKNN